MCAKQGLGFRVWGLGFGVWGLEFRFTSRSNEPGCKRVYQSVAPAVLPAHNLRGNSQFAAQSAGADCKNTAQTYHSRTVHTDVHSSTSLNFLNPQR